MHQLIRFAAGGEVERLTLGNDSLQALVRQPQIEPVVFLLSYASVPVIVELAGLVDRGKKEDERELGRYFLGVKGVPLLRARYASSGKLTGSVWTFLGKAARVGEAKSFYLAVQPELVHPLWRAVPEAEHGESAPTPVGIQPPAAASVMPSPPSPASLPAPRCDPIATPEIVGSSAVIEAVRREIARLAPLAGAVLFSGPLGAGKELAAEVLHRSGPRAGRHFLTMGCRWASAPAQVSVLFGVGGTSDSATGLLTAAHRSTLLIAGFEWLAEAVQARLVKFLREGRIGHQVVDVRLVFASSLSLKDLVVQRRIHPELTRLLAAAEIRIPALAEHPEDIPAITDHLWRSITRQDTPLPAEVPTELQSHTYPNNVDGLNDVLRRLFAYHWDPPITRNHLLAALEESRSTHVSSTTGASGAFRAERDLESVFLAQVEQVATAVRALWMDLRPLRHGRSAFAADEALALVPVINSRLLELDELSEVPLRFPSEDLYEEYLMFKGEITALRDRICQGPGRIGLVWETGLEAEIETKLRQLEKHVFEARDRLNASRLARQLAPKVDPNLNPSTA